MKFSLTAMLAETVQQAGLSPEFDSEIEKIEENRSSLMRLCCDMISKLDTADKKNWRPIVVLSLIAEVTEDEMQQELGAASSTIYRWTHDDVAPREGTRRLMKGALINLLTQKIDAIRREPPPGDQAKRQSSSDRVLQPVT